MKFLRWILVLPASILSLVIVFYFYRIVFAFMGENPSSFFHKAFIGFMGSVVYMYVGVYVAPSYKKITSLVLAIIASILGVLSIVNGLDLITNVTAIIAVFVMYGATNENGIQS